MPRYVDLALNLGDFWSNFSGFRPMAGIQVEQSASEAHRMQNVVDML